MTEASPIWRGFRRYWMWPRPHTLTSLCRATSASHGVWSLDADTAAVTAGGGVFIRFTTL